MKHIKAPAEWANGTSLQGHADVPYVDLLAAFGKPYQFIDEGNKSDVMWAIQFEDGTLATIYNYKDGKNYNGSDGLEVFEITDWHIGGRDWKAAQRVMAALGIV